jgi:hypothetical protein
VTLRPLHPTDIPILKARAEESGYPYPEDAEITLVVELDGQIVTAAAMKLSPELYLWPMANLPPSIKFQALILLHREMAKELRELGYTEANAQLPPAIAARFSRRLRRSFGWIQNTWENWFIRF